MTDNYEFNKSIEPQTRPYTDKQYNNYINDINSGVYTNNGLSLVQFDLSSIQNSSDLLLVLPITMVAAFSTSTAGALSNATAGNVNLLSLKNNSIHLIHRADISHITINEKTAEDAQQFINIAKNFQMMSEMFIGDLKTVGDSLGLGSELDNWKSKVYNGSTSATVANRRGNGMTNNRPFTPQATTGGADSVCSTASQFDRVINTGLQKRLGRYQDTTAGATNGIFGNSAAFISSLSQLKNDFYPVYQVLNNAYLVWDSYCGPWNIRPYKHYLILDILDRNHFLIAGMIMLLLNYQPFFII
jgi:hypothetical protein